jgi:hypothetical protein
LNRAFLRDLNGKISLKIRAAVKFPIVAFEKEAGEGNGLPLCVGQLAMEWVSL